MRVANATCELCNPLREEYQHGTLTSSLFKSPDCLKIGAISILGRATQLFPWFQRAGLLTVHLT